MITLIVARARNGAIGRAGTIPWSVPEDLRFFQRETLGGALIMGRATWQSLPVKPLPKRLNIVVSGTPDAAPVMAATVTSAIAHAADEGYQRIYGIGGARIYQDMLPLAHRLLISHVDLDVTDADTFFPPIDLSSWQKVGEQTLRPADPYCQLVEYLKM